MDENIEAECDEEIARISSQASKEGRDGCGDDRGGVGDSGHGIAEGTPRPMSWDGELSDNDDAIVSTHPCRIMITIKFLLKVKILNNPLTQFVNETD